MPTAEEDREDRFAPELLDRLDSLGADYGALGVALAAASLTDRRALVASLTGPQQPPEVEPLNLGPARSPVERAAREYFGADYLPPSGQGRDVEHAETFRPLLVAFRAGWQRALEWAERDAGDPHAVCRAIQEGEREAAEEQADTLRAEVARLSGLLAAESNRSDEFRRQLDEAHARADQYANSLDGALAEARPVTNVVNLAGEPARPHPAANAWPDNAVTISYRELRLLVALHLDLARQAMPNTSPWAWIKHRAQAMRDGEAPLLLSEVLDQ